MSTVALTPKPSQMPVMPLISFEELARQIYVAIITSLKDDKRVYEWVKNIEEQQRIEASKKLADSHRSWIPVAFTVASVACSVGLTIATIHPQVLFNGLDWVTELFGCNGMLNGFRQPGGNLDAKEFTKFAEKYIGNGQRIVDGGKEFVHSRADATRAELTSDKTTAEARYNDFNKFAHNASSEAQEAIRSLQQLNSEEAQAKRAMVR